VKPQAGYTIITGRAYKTAGAFTYAEALGLLLLCKQHDISIRYEAFLKEGTTKSYVGLKAAWVLLTDQ